MAGRVGQAGDSEYAMHLRGLERQLQNGIDPETLRQKVIETLEKGDRFIEELKNWITALSKG
jgi:hypothetical protein